MAKRRTRRQRYWASKVQAAAAASPLSVIDLFEHSATQALLDERQFKFFDSLGLPQNNRSAGRRTEERFHE